MLSKRKGYDILRGQLDSERSSFMGLYRDLGDYILPMRPRFTLTDANRGDRRNNKILDCTPTFAANTLSSGMMSGITSPARPWFRLTTPDPELSEYGPVKEYLHRVSMRMNQVFLRSNLYNVLPPVYGDLGTFGTSPMMIEEDFERVIRMNSFPVGSYYIAKDFRGQVNVFFREFRMTVRQVVETFGRADQKTGKPDWSHISDHVRNLYEKSNYETWVDVCHVISPNQDYDQGKADSKFKRFSSCYYERGAVGGSNSYVAEEDRFLRESGYDYFPVLCPRWQVTGEDVYGTSCPGMTSLGDNKQLQLGERRCLQAIEKMVNPPMVAPSNMKTVKSTILPGEVTYYDETTDKKFRPAHEVNFRIDLLEGKQQQCRERVNRAFYVDLFLMLAYTDRKQITAREIEERHEEKLLALGPVLEQLNQDLLNPLIDNTFEIMDRQRLLPEPPDELQGEALKVEYLSIMAQAQKLVAVGGIERFTGFLMQFAPDPADPTWDKVDKHQLVDEYGEAVGLSPRIIRPDDKVTEIAAQRQQANQAAQKAAMVKEGAAAASNLASADMSGDNALTALLRTAKAGEITPAVA